MLMAVPALAAPEDYEWSWKDYTPNEPPRVVEATAAIEMGEVEAPGNAWATEGGFFVPMQKRAAADVGNLFRQVSDKPDNGEDYRVRLTFRWNGEAHPSAQLIDGRSGEVLASLKQDAPRHLRAVALNLKDAMRALKADLVQAIERNPPLLAGDQPPHRDPL